MTKRRHTAEQIIGKLREAEVDLAKGMPLVQVCRKLEPPSTNETLIGILTRSN